MDKVTGADALVADLYQAIASEKRRADQWRFIANEMGYEPNAHKHPPLGKWLTERIAMYRQQAAESHRLAAQAEPREWRGIESAPKDGTKFDAWVPDAFGGQRMTDLSFNRKGQLRQHGLLTPAELPRWPTHWMPLPSAPEPPAKEAEGGA